MSDQFHECVYAEWRGIHICEVCGAIKKHGEN